MLLARNDLYSFDCTPQAGGFTPLTRRAGWCRSDRSAPGPAATGNPSPSWCHRVTRIRGSRPAVHRESGTIETSESPNYSGRQRYSHTSSPSDQCFAGGLTHRQRGGTVPRSTTLGLTATRVGTALSAGGPEHSLKAGNIGDLLLIRRRHDDLPRTRTGPARAPAARRATARFGCRITSWSAGDQSIPERAFVPRFSGCTNRGQPVEPLRRLLHDGLP